MRSSLRNKTPDQNSTRTPGQYSSRANSAEDLGSWYPAWLTKSSFGDFASLSTGGALSIALGFLATWITPRLPVLRRLAMRLFILSGPLLMLMIFLIVCYRLGMGTDHANWTPVHVGIATVAFALWCWFFVNINTLALHRYYRNKLCECYLTRRSSDDGTERSKLPRRKRRGFQNLNI